MRAQHPQVKLLKAVVDGIVVDVSFNQLVRRACACLYHSLDSRCNLSACLGAAPHIPKCMLQHSARMLPILRQRDRSRSRHDRLCLALTAQTQGGLLTLNALEEVDAAIGGDHIFKRSIILVGGCFLDCPSPAVAASQLLQLWLHCSVAPLLRHAYVSTTHTNSATKHPHHPPGQGVVLL